MHHLDRGPGQPLRQQLPQRGPRGCGVGPRGPGADGGDVVGPQPGQHGVELAARLHGADRADVRAARAGLGDAPAVLRAHRPGGRAADVQTQHGGHVSFLQIGLHHLLVVYWHRPMREARGEECGLTQRVPKYWLVKEQLRGLVDAGEPGTALPTERELAEQLATSRTTVRQAIAELVVEGLLVRTQGSGTYIAEPRLVHIRQLSSFTDDLGAARVENRVLGVTVEPATGRPRSGSG